MAHPANLTTDTRAAWAVKLLQRHPATSPIGCNVVIRAIWFYADARRDPFVRTGPLAAAWFVIRHWAWLHTVYEEN